VGNPQYRVRASGMGGSGYARPPLPDELSKRIKNADGEMIDVVVDDKGKPIIVPGATTVLKAMGDTPGLTQWKIDQTAAYAVANIDGLVNRTEEQGWGMLRFFHKREPDLDDPIRNAHKGVLNDLANLGTWAHEYTQADITQEDFPPAPRVPEHYQMLEAWETFKFEHTIEPVMTEQTVYGDGWAGTYDCLWYIDGKLTLLDEKTSRRIGDSHMMQLSALRRGVLDGQQFSRDPVTGWSLVDVPVPEQYGFIKIRPDDYDNRGNMVPAHAEFTTVSEAELDIHFEKFQACLRILEADAKLKQFRKEEDK